MAPTCSKDDDDLAEELKGQKKVKIVLVKGYNYMLLLHIFVIERFKALFC